MNENNAYLLSFENFINKDFEEKSDANESKKVIVEEKETISEGYWKCMGCGKHIPLDIEKCECGYKKQYQKKIREIPKKSIMKLLTCSLL